MKAIDLHIRGRQKVMCEAYENSSGISQHIPREGFVSRTEGDYLFVVIARTASSIHRFLMLEKDGYYYEGDPNAVRGWRMPVAQFQPTPKND